MTTEEEEDIEKEMEEEITGDTKRGFFTLSCNK